MSGAGRARIIAEVRIVGPALLASAVGAPMAGAALVATLGAGGAPHAALVRAAAAVLEGLCPLATAVAVVSLVGRDRCVELVLTTPGSYRQVFFLRAGLVAGLGAGTTLVAATGLFAAGAYPAGVGAAGVVLVWAAPMIWLAGIGLLVALATLSSAAASAVIGGLWLAEALFHAEFVARPLLRVEYLYATISHLSGGAWWANRAVLCATGAVALLGAGALLERPERLLAGEPA